MKLKIFFAAILALIVVVACKKELQAPGNTNDAPKPKSTGLTLYTGSLPNAIKNVSDSDDERVNRALVKLTLAFEDILDDSSIRAWIKSECISNDTYWIKLEDFYDEYSTEESEIVDFLTSDETFGFYYASYSDFLDSLEYEGTAYEPVIGILNDGSTSSDPVLSSGVELPETALLDDCVLAYDYDFASPKPSYLTEGQADSLETQVFGLSIHQYGEPLIVDPKRSAVSTWPTVYEEEKFYYLDELRIHTSREKGDVSEVAIRGYYLDVNESDETPSFYFLTGGTSSARKTDEIIKISKVDISDIANWQHVQIYESKIDGNVVSSTAVRMRAIDITYHSNANLYYSVFERDWYATPNQLGSHTDGLNNVGFSTHGKMKYKDDYFIFSDEISNSSFKFNNNAQVDKSTLHSSPNYYTESDSRIDIVWKYY